MRGLEDPAETLERLCRREVNLVEENPSSLAERRDERALHKREHGSAPALSDGAFGDG